MAADRIIKCTNKDGISMRFTERDLTPFILVSVDGIYDAINNMHISENTMIDGAQYQGSTVKYRNIVLTLKDDGNFPKDRNLLNQLFKENESGLLEISENGENQRNIEYYVEYMKSTGTFGVRYHEISLICPDPFFYDPSDITVYMASWISDFEFEFEDIDGFEFGHQSAERIQNIVNDYAEDNIGMTIRISCSGAVVNPSIIRVESDTHITVGSIAKSLTTEVGDVVTITTGTGNKHVYLTREGVTTEINEYLTEDSEFIQLMRGNNNIGYSADSGEEYMTVAISYRFKHARA